MGEPALMGAATVRKVLSRHGIRLRSSLGQNFVIDPNTIRKVVNLSGTGPGDRVLEVGAGAGSLTLALAGAAKHVTAIEIDEALVPVLEETVGDVANVEVVVGDVTALDLGSFDADLMVSNLPYNVAASVVVSALEQAPRLRKLTVMTQREVGERLASRPGSKVYGKTSALVALHGTAHIVANVSRNAFFPVPNVDSVVVSIERHPEPFLAPEEIDRYKSIVRAAFSQRRKTIRNTLSGIAEGANAAAALCKRAGVDPTARAEELSVDDFIALTRAPR